MRKQTRSKKRKATAPKRKVAKKAQREIRGGMVTVIRPTSRRIDIGTPTSPNWTMVHIPGIVIFANTADPTMREVYQIGFGPRSEMQ